MHDRPSNLPKRARPIILSVLLTMILSLTVSCGRRNIGWGVIVWSDREDSYPTGLLVPIFEESKLKDSYTFGFDDSSDRFEIPKWRLTAFKKSSEAMEFSTGFSRWSLQYARPKPGVDGLLVRSEPDQSSQWVYRLRQREVIKIIGRQEEESTVGSRQGFWYRVLTSDGTSGYCFDYNLETGTLEDFEARDNAANQDPLIASFLGSTFRPDYYRNMIRTGRIDLTRFSPDVGFFPDPENNRVILQMQTYQVTFEYEAIESAGGGRYRFVGSSLILLMSSENETIAQYTHDGRDYSVWFARIDEDVEFLILNEEARRLDIYDRIRARGNVLESSAYGTILLDDDMAFEWTSFSRLVPDIIPARSSAGGKVDFPLFMGRALAARYEGTVSFHFDTMKPDTFVHFLYRYTENGVQFTHVPEREITDFYVQELTSPPLIIFFSLDGAR